MISALTAGRAAHAMSYRYPSMGLGKKNGAHSAPDVHSLNGLAVANLFDRFCHFALWCKDLHQLPAAHHHAFLI